MTEGPGIVVAGLSGDSGKTLLSLGLAAVWRRQGLTVAPFKKGPDYIDAAWLTLAAGRFCRNLDSYLMTADTICETWRNGVQQADIGLVEGNRGIFDGVDVQGSHSTAELAKLLQIPVLLVVDATKMTRTTAALVMGVRALDPDLKLAGVVLNRIGGVRHASVAADAIEAYADVPVLGVVPRLRGGELIPGRHLGLVTTDEHPATSEAVARAADVVEEHLDLDQLLQIAGCADRTGRGKRTKPGEADDHPPRIVRIGVLRDAAFPFYYPENLESLEKHGAELVRISALSDQQLPEGLNALYIGGGFPETHSRQLSGNRSFLASLRTEAENGLPIYAECGGLMLLAESIDYDGTTSPMSGVLPIRIGWSAKPAGHGYVRGVVDRDNPFYPVGTEIAGHEFHHSHVRNPEGAASVVSLNRGTGIGGGRDGLVRWNTLALYTHVHAAGLAEWSRGMIRAAKSYR